MGATTSPSLQVAIGERFRSTRRQTIALCEPLTPEDMMVQSSPECSPAKWHLAHTAWFFESFILREFLLGYRLFNKDFPWLFNSYYASFADFPEKRIRSSFSRPGLDEILPSEGKTLAVRIVGVVGDDRNAGLENAVDYRPQRVARNR